MNATTPVIETLGLVKGFGRTRVSCSLSLSVAAGEFRGFLGSNGACKSVTLSILLRLIRSTARTARVFGLDRWAHPVGMRRDIAVLRLTVVPRRAGSRRHGPVR